VFSKYIIYVDESGDANWSSTSEYPLLCLNFCLFEKEYYLSDLIPKFNQLKFKYWGCDNLVLHERDLRKPGKIKDAVMRSKYIKIMHGSRKDEFMDELSDLMKEAKFVCFCVVLDKRKVPPMHQAHDPYNICLSRGFRQVRDYLSNIDPDELDKETHFVFEKRGHDVDLELSKAYKQILTHGALMGLDTRYDFDQFRFELMDKKNNSTGLQIADLTARPIGNHYLKEIGDRNKVDMRAYDILKDKLRFCNGDTCENGKCDILHTAL